MIDVLTFLRDMCLMMPHTAYIMERTLKKFPKVNVHVSRCSVKSENYKARKGPCRTVVSNLPPFYR